MIPVSKGVEDQLKHSIRKDWDEEKRWKGEEEEEEGGRRRRRRRGGRRGRLRGRGGK
jgi:hypothetical protein